ncbi:MAG: A/G-specific adenine glycosylase [Candidatus Kapaibacterium sp.]
MRGPSVQKYQTCALFSAPPSRVQQPFTASSASMSASMRARRRSVHPPLPPAHRIPALQERVLAWYRTEQRTFPWRSERPDPYLVLVSEVMLQQTQTSRVAVLLPPFLAKFPTVDALASAGTAEIIKAWQGLGYNSRALRLRECARAIVERFGGHVPGSAEELLTLPGIGPYTSHAVAVFAFHADITVLDVNLRRVYSRYVAPQATSADILGDTELQPIAAALQPKGHASAWNQALMDIGAQFCKAARPRCGECVLADTCASAHRIVTVRKPRRPEPSHRDIPRRIWRGKVLDILRESVTGSTAKALSRSLMDAPDAGDVAWMESVAQDLVRDGFVRNDGSRYRLRDE